MTFKTILIVEDDPDIRANLQELFEGEGYPVLLAGHGRAALDLLALTSQPKPGLILLDLMMPVMDGASFLLELKNNYPSLLAEIPIFVVSAKGSAHRPTTKITGFLNKPLDLDELCRIAAQYCGSKE